MDFNKLRETYKNFYFHDFEIYEDDSSIQIQYDFEIEGLSHFNPSLLLPKQKGRDEIGLLKVFRETAFSLGMIELISYWKITCPEKVIVECASLTPDQIKWWKKLYYYGLGEFFYRNKIEIALEEFMELSSIGEKIEGRVDESSCHGNLIPVGGGKDSFVTLDVLKDSYEDNHALVINHIPSAIHSAEKAGYTNEKLIVVERSLDSRMLEFNKAGYLNGHTPFSALAAFISFLVAIVFQKQFICLSNEDSANESTVKDSKVNHQYSKTFEFEQDFNEYTKNYLSPEIHYFSLLRPISEIQIAGIFSTLKEYHSVFRSCNVGQKEEKWCAKCAKCLFVCIILSAYLSREELIEIFHRDILDDPDMLSLFEQLTGLQDNKPFECVGTREEVNLAIVAYIRQHDALPYLYEKYKESEYYSYYKDKRIDFLSWNDHNLVPEDYAKKLKERLEEMIHV
ncbi:MAG: hypothetical protein IKE51_01920 [Solobacterium sp.]|nr:hypothetical protein [Solobacterium sp.]